MTDEQLDAIEKLAEAATPGPWIWRGPSSDDPADLWTADGKDAIVCVQTTNADVKFIRAMREYALPMVKALREARALLQSVARVCRGSKEPDQADLSVLGNVLRERDESRAECVELQAIIDYGNRKDGPTFQAHLGEAKALWAQAEAEKERDAARAEVARLREAITRFVDQYPWQQGPEIQELKALKEGER